MVREKEIIHTRLMKVTDIISISISFVLAYFFTMLLRSYLQLGPMAFGHSLTLSGAIFFLRNHFWLILVTIPSWVSLMSLDGVYFNFRTKPFLEITWRILRTGMVSLLVLSSLVFLLKMTLTSRFYVTVFAILAFVGIIGEKIIWKKFFDYSHRMGYNLVNLLIVGTGKRAQEFIETVNLHKNWGLHIIGLIDDDPKLLGKNVHNYEVIGRIRDVPKIIRDHIIDRVIFVIPRMWLSRIEGVLEHCEREGIDTAITVDLYRPKLAQTIQSNFAGIPLIEFQTVLANESDLFIKRIVDIFVSIVALILFSPLLILVALGIKITSKGSVFFRQIRCGRSGRPFRVFKFRSMVVGAEMKKRALEKQNEMNGPTFKMKRDPRVTVFGKFMRKFSIDELPQLFNVLRGDMSLVGPRPALPTEVELYESWQRRRLSMKPGITCVWQVSGRNRIDFEQWMEMDLHYIDHFSLWMDFKILARTLLVVVTGYGAS